MKLTNKQLKRRLKLVDVCYNGLLESLIEDGVFIEGKHYHKGFVGDRNFKLNGEDYSYDNSIDMSAHYITNFTIIADLTSVTAEADMRLKDELSEQELQKCKDYKEEK